MIYLYFLDDDMATVIVFCMILLALCTAVIIAIGVDLLFGIRESKKQGIYTHSQGLRKTTAKLSSYLSLILVAFVLDSINPLFVFISSVPHLPILTILVSMFFIFTEWISIREHTSKGMRKKFRQTPVQMREMLKEIKDIKDDIKNIVNDK